MAAEEPRRSLDEVARIATEDGRQARLVALDDLLKRASTLSQQLCPELLTLHVRVVTCADIVAEIVASLVPPRTTAPSAAADHTERRYDPPTTEVR